MSTTKNQYTSDEMAVLGAAAIERYVRDKLQPEDHGKFLAIDVHSGEYELDHDDDTAATRIESRIPNAQIWLARVGHRTAFKMRPRYRFKM